MKTRAILLAVVLSLSACAQSPLHGDAHALPPPPVSVAPPAAAVVVPPPNPNVETPDAPTRPLDLHVQALGDDAPETTDALPPAEAPTVAQTPPSSLRPHGNGQRQGLLDASSDYLKRMDKDGDGRVSESEFIDWMSYSFNARDVNRDDVLTPDELPGGKGTPITRAQFRDNLRRRFLAQDSNHDGYLSVKELAAPPQ